MSNLLKVAMIDTILSLYHKGWSQRRIAGELGINRETVARYIKQARAAPKPAIAPIGSDPLGTASVDLPLSTTSASVEHRRGRKSECEAWRELIQSKCDSGLSAQRIYQD